jgi:hypothetical protein
MPEPVTFQTPETPALSEENQEMLKALSGETEGDQQLLAGKYKSVEELEKAYKELQSKLGQRPQEAVAAPADDDDQQEEEAADEEPEQPAGDAKEIYGEFIGSRLEEAGIDFGDMNTRWQQTGELTSDDYTQLEEAGFTKDMVDAYLSGLQYKAAQDNALTAKEVYSIKQEFGGEKAYGEMLEWAAQNLSEEEVDGFNQIINSGNLSSTRLAITGLYSRYSRAVGREPKLIGGRAAKGSTDKFESTAQLVEAMKDPRYAQDPAYRKKVEDKLSRSSIF